MVLTKEPKNGSTDTSVTPTDVQKREMGGRRCRVVFSYAPQHDDELQLCVGQVITVLQEVEEGWWKGVLGSQVGMFPSNFVEDTSEEPCDSSPPESKLENINNQLNVNGEGKVLRKEPIEGIGFKTKLNDLKKDGSSRRDSNSPPNNLSPKILGSSGSSAFQPVTRSKESSKENGQVKEFRELPHRLPPALEPKAEKVTSKVDKTRINAADKERINSIERDRITITIGEEKNKTDGGSKKDGPVPTASGTPPQLPPPQLPPKPVRELAKVMFPYTVAHEDELELKEGDIITVLCKELEDKGWWRGELNGQVGVFPDNFVELITVEETAKPPRPEKPAAVLAKKGSPSSSADTTPTGTLDKADKEPPPPLPEKKVQAPPPPEKKPTVQVTTDAHDGGVSSREASEITMPKQHKRDKVPLKEDLSLTLDTDGERLKHVTHLRPKGPSRRRPPSGVFKDNMKILGNEDSEPLPPTPEDDLENETPIQEPNGHLPLSELPQLNLPALSPTSPKPTVELRSRPEPIPRPETVAPSVPWLQELRLNQKKRLSNVVGADGESAPVSAPVISPKPPVLSQKPEEKPPFKPVKSPHSTTENTSIKTKPELRVSETEPKPSPPPTILSKNKPLPQTPVTRVEAEKITPSQPQSEPRVVAESRKAHPHNTEGKEAKKLPAPPAKGPESSMNMEEKINAIYKDLLPKMKKLEEHLEERLEEQRKEQNRHIQMLMNELDEERKKRACMEVEIERLKKLVNAYAQV